MLEIMNGEMASHLLLMRVQKTHICWKQTFPTKWPERMEEEVIGAMVF